MGQRNSGGVNDWLDFRGPGGDGHAGNTPLPRAWNEKSGILWRTPVHDSGWSSPIVVGDQIWLTTATEHGHEQFVVCIHRDTGRVLLDEKVFTNANPERIGAQGNTYASPSPVATRDVVVAHFGTYGTVAYANRTRKILWKRTDLNCQHFQGPGSSPVIWRDRVVLTFDGADVQYLAALDLRSGKTIWKTDRGIDWASDKFGAASDPDQRKAYSTPFVWKRKGRDELVTAGARCFASYDPATGKELWRIPHGGFSNATRPLVAGNRLLLNTGFNRPEFWALRADHDRAPAESDIVWKIARGVPTMSSPLVHNGLLYFTADADFLTCVDLENGQEVWKERLGGRFYASLMMAGGALYAISDRGRSVVLEPGRAFRTLGEGVLPEGSRSSPAVARGRLYLRTYDALVCIGNT